MCVWVCAMFLFMLVRVCVPGWQARGWRPSPLATAPPGGRSADRSSASTATPTPSSACRTCPHTHTHTHTIFGFHSRQRDGHSWNPLVTLGSKHRLALYIICLTGTSIIKTCAEGFALSQLWVTLRPMFAVSHSKWWNYPSYTTWRTTLLEFA